MSPLAQPGATSARISRSRAVSSARRRPRGGCAEAGRARRAAGWRPGARRPPEPAAARRDGLRRTAAGREHRGEPSTAARALVDVAERVEQRHALRPGRHQLLLAGNVDVGEPPQPQPLGAEPRHPGLPLGSDCPRDRSDARRTTASIATSSSGTRASRLRALLRSEPLRRAGRAGRARGRRAGPGPGTSGTTALPACPRRRRGPATWRRGHPGRRAARSPAAPAVRGDQPLPAPHRPERLVPPAARSRRRAPPPTSIRDRQQQRLVVRRAAPAPPRRRSRAPRPSGRGA